MKFLASGCCLSLLIGLWSITPSYAQADPGDPWGDGEWSAAPAAPSAQEDRFQRNRGRDRDQDRFDTMDQRRNREKREQSKDRFREKSRNRDQ
jgi:hypothetical protein